MTETVSEKKETKEAQKTEQIEKQASGTATSSPKHIVKCFSAFKWIAT